MNQICDGCRLGPDEYDCDEGELLVCPDCQYSVCDDCQCHACTYPGSFGPPGARCSGVGPCSCGSCRNELHRQLDPSRANPWNCWMLPPLGDATIDRSGLGLHHNLSRGTCRCEQSNFGIPYADMCAFEGRIKCYMGGRGGARFLGPIKSRAQLKLEEMIVRRDLPFIPVEERKCYNHSCDADADLRCSRCRSAWYCSKDCQASHYRHKQDSHKEECGKYYPSSEWKAASEDAKGYKEKHGHYPGEKTWDCSPPRLTELVMVHLREADHPLVSGRKGVSADDIVAELSTGRKLKRQQSGGKEMANDEKPTRMVSLDHQRV